ncbi:hypothetical protein HDU98_000784 [Podochytrium sp. JEL0797]|nr:hypothetical protein HDU98_000784 [Podochytrium sp. JEL0797]
MIPFVLCFAQIHLNFRLAELRALAVLENVEIDFDPSELLEESPFLIVRMKSAKNAKKLLTRSILIKEVIELWAQGDTLDELLERVKEIPIEKHDPYLTCTFKYTVTVFGNTLTRAQQVEHIQRFAFLPHKGKIDLKNPAVTFSLYEDHFDATMKGQEVPDAPRRLFWGVFVGAGERGAIQKFDLKKRGYLGTTSMDAELSLVTSNVALARTGSFVLDPFVGTGSFLLTSSYFGSYTIGSDIDIRQLRGKGNGKSIASNVTQYNLSTRVLGTVVSDLAHHPWRQVEFWDAIVTDPPYGVRAGAKKIAVNPKEPAKLSVLNKQTGEYRLPQSIPYELDEVMSDLISFAAKHLVPGGRLVYWLPTITDAYNPKDVPRHKRLRLLDNCEQQFGKWSRRLIVMEKLKAEEPDLDVDALLMDIERGIQAKALDEEEMKVEEGGLVTLIDSPAHAKFRDGFFNIQ